MFRSKAALALASLLSTSLSIWLSISLCAAPALAHINLLEPAARVPGAPDTTLSLGPCGQRENERSDDGAQVFRRGQSIDVVWEVYVQHVSYFRIAFDPDGDDSFSVRRSLPSDPDTDDPTQLPASEGEIILDYIEDRTGDIGRVERRVTLPDVECERCTLQVTQFTYGLPIDDATYYQCADLVLTGADDGDLGSDAGESDGVGSDPAEADGSASCSFSAAAARAPAAPAAWAWLTPLVGWLALRARRSRAQRAGRASIHCRNSST